MDAEIGSGTHPRPPRGRRNKRLVEDGRLDDATLQLFEPSNSNPEEDTSSSAKGEPTLDQQYLIKVGPVNWARPLSGLSDLSPACFAPELTPLPPPPSTHAVGFKCT